MEYTLEEKKQLVLTSYRKAYDYDMALSVYEITDEERDEMEKDSLFWLQLKKIECEMKERLIVDLTYLSSDKNRKENVRLEAIKTLGKILYPEAFSKKDESEAEGNKVIFYIPDNGRGVNSSKGDNDLKGGTLGAKKHADEKKREDTRRN